ncbi:Heme A synthase [Geodia barretti]|uniref:Heme A synthase n=1 Tax=Geodia barretti TaxID=519541 RepID=A0AA35XIE4_GEOBA|nr:Heme A synthase [Geodia barretti]
MEPGASSDEQGSPGRTTLFTNEYLVLRAELNERHRWLRRLALASVLATFALIVLGGVVRVTGSGLGCGGEWPLCDGSLIPPLTKEDIIEYSHRLVASAIVGPLIVATFLVAVFRYRRIPSVIMPSSVAVVFLLAQGGLGGVTVLTELPGHVVAAHLALAQALLGCLIWLTVSAYRVKDSDRSPPVESEVLQATQMSSMESDAGSDKGKAERPDTFPRLAVFTAIATYFLLLSGAYVTATTGALAACSHWPLCDGSGSLWPSTNLELVHMLHRVVAALIGVLILYTMFRAFRYGMARLSSGGLWILFIASFGGALLLTQVIIGAAAIWSNFPVLLRAYHIGLATAVWGLMAAVALLSRSEPAEQDIVLRRGLTVDEVQNSTTSLDT